MESDDKAAGGRVIALAVLAAWAIACAMMLVRFHSQVAAFDLTDTDDWMRLQQVRDWLGGQSWFDVTQYRLDPPHGFAMHWSRLLDMPIAALIVALRPLIGVHGAEIVAATVVPLLLLLGVIAMTTLLTRRLAGDGAAILAPLMVICCGLSLLQLTPLRIDHHGWQMLAGLATIHALMWGDARRSGMWAGMFAAFWLHISLEALPLVAAIGALAALRWLVDRAHWMRLFAFLASLAGASLLFFAATRAMALWPVIVCDAVAAQHLAILLMAALAVGAGRLVDHRGPLARAALLLLIGGGAVALYAGLGPRCLAGPFAELDPLTRRYWYEQVVEGMPVWKQSAPLQVILLAFPPIALIGCWLGWRGAETAESQRNWLTMAALLTASYALSILVLRAASLTQMLAVPGVSLIAALLLRRARALSSIGLRVLASAAAVLVPSPILSTYAGALVLNQHEVTQDRRKAALAKARRQQCGGPCDDFVVLRRLPPSLIFASIDATPRLLANTQHRYWSAGYHRNSRAMSETISVFMAPPAEAARFLRARGFDHIVVNPTQAETDLYRKRAPHGLMARLVSGRAPDWLEPVPMGDSLYRLWRLRD